MKNILLLLCVCFASCSDDNNDLNIVSLNTFGTKFCRNDVVKVFISAEVDYDQDITYHWECEGGKLTNPQGLFENVWVAPNEAGTYDLWCNVKCGKTEETRHTKMIVTDELFYSNFETPYFTEGWKNSNMTAVFDVNKGNNGALKLTSKKLNATYEKSWIEIPLPFSTQMDYAVSSVLTDATFVGFRINFNRFEDSSENVNRICFTTHPKTGYWKVSYDLQNYVTGVLQNIIIQEGIDTDRFKFQKDLFKSIAISFDASKKLIIYHEGEKFFESSVLSEIQETYSINSSGLILDNKVVVFVDDFFAFDNGTICTADERQR